MTETTGYHLAQLNIGRMVAPIDSPELKDFVDNLDRINALADGSPGFVWRLQTDDGNATDIAVDESDPLLIVNMSVWESADALFNYVYRSDHVGIMKRRREFFQKPDGPFMVLWWVPAGHIPTIDEAFERLDSLRRKGPTPQAFTFKTPFEHPDDTVRRPLHDMEPERFCA